MNNQIKINVTKESKTNTISVEAEIPEMNPRKGIDHIRYDVVNAREAAVEKYGRDVGNLTTFSTNPVLENIPRENGNILKGRWLFYDVASDNEMRSRNKVRTRRTRKASNTRSRRTTTNSQTSE